MAYRMTEISEKVYVGVTGSGDLDIEVWSGPKHEFGSEIEYEAFVPAEALSGLFEYLRRHT